jgi:acetyl esterase/lipase
LYEILKTLPVPLTPSLIPKSRKLTIEGTLSDSEINRNGAFRFEEIEIKGYQDSIISLIICQPTATDNPSAVIYNIHGGGMVSGNNRTAELAGELKRAEQLNLAVVSVNYRLAPEHPDPIPLEDCYAGLEWLSANLNKYNFRSDRIIVSGNSAGGGLAAGVTLLARDRRGPNIMAQMLQCPMLDDRCNTPSAVQMEGIGLWETTSNITGWNALLGSRRGSKEVSYYTAPARAEDLSCLPPTFIDVGAVESLRDETIDYAKRIWLCGGNAELHVWGGAFHSFDQWVPDAIVSKLADETRVKWLKRLL